MLKVLAIVTGIFVVAVGAVLVYAATKPDAFRVERSVTVNAPAEKIYPYVNELKRWTDWSPYEERDPAMKRTYSGPEKGKGAVYEWDGNNNVGKGRMEIVEASSPERVRIQLDFIKPFEGHNLAEFTMVPKGGDPKGGPTVVTWAMYGPSPYISKVIGTVMDMDEMIGKDFSAGLAKLKAAAEK